MGLTPDDVRDVVMCMSTEDSAGRIVSETTGEWMYVFRPEVNGCLVYVKLVVREGCVIVSFHEDGGAGGEEEK